MESKCPHHENEELVITGENYKGYCPLCRRSYFLSKIAKLRKPKLEAKWKIHKSIHGVRKFGRI